MKATKPRKVFKKSFGQANHFIITALVGLNAIERGDLKDVPEELHTSWSPKDPQQSARRARRFVLNTALMSAVDAIDVYLTMLWRSPKWISGDDVEGMYSSAGRSVYNKAMGLSSILQIQDTTRAMVEVIITWRNNVTHELANNTLSPSSARILKDKSSECGVHFCGLNPSALEEKANAGSDLTFKETTSLIRATHLFVEEVDSRVIQRLSMEAFSKTLFIGRLNGSPDLKKRYFGANQERQAKIIRNILQAELGVASESTIISSAVAQLGMITVNDCEQEDGYLSPKAAQGAAPDEVSS